MSDLARLDWLAAACVMAVSQLRPISAQGDLVSRGADPPSQDRRSLGYLVSSPPLATDHGSRLHQLSGGAACRLSGSHHFPGANPAACPALPLSGHGQVSPAATQ